MLWRQHRFTPNHGYATEPRTSVGRQPGGDLGLLTLSPATAAATVVRTPAGIQADPICNSLSASLGLCCDYVPMAFHPTEKLFSFLPSSQMQSHSHSWPLLPGFLQNSQVSPCNPSPTAERAGKDEPCKSMQGSEVQTALTKVQGSSQSSQRPPGPEEAGKMGIQLVLSQAQLSAALASWEESTEGEDRAAEQSTPKSNYVQ